jgi:hypothetical protein
MSMTRKETKALLAIVWHIAHEAYLIGYSHGEQGLGAPNSPYENLIGQAAANNASLTELDSLSKQVQDLAKQFG